jgi:dolichol-phosphate mannosyltransferase
VKSPVRLPLCFLRFAIVGAAGYLVNLAVFASLVNVCGAPYVPAAIASFGVAVTHNYLLNRAWTFRDARRAFFGQGVRFIVVSLAALGLNLAFLHALVVLGLPELAAQAAAISLAFPANFLGNRIWSFRPLRPDQSLVASRLYSPMHGCEPVRAAVCLPTYNERENLPSMLEALRRVLGPRDVVLVIDDNSPDGTGALAERLGDQFGFIHVLHRPEKRGLGRAYLDGFRHALALGAELVLEMDCDFSHDPGDVPRLIEGAGEADLVLGSRYVPGGGADGLTLLRRMLSRGGCLYARAVLGVAVRDLTGGFKCYRRETLLAIGLEEVSSSGYVFQIETTYRVIRSGGTVREVPIRFEERRAGSSKMGLRIAAEAVWKVPALRVRFATRGGEATLRSKPAAAAP